MNDVRAGGRRLRSIILAGLALGALAAGCQDFGSGGTGERVVPDEVFHHIQSVEMNQLEQAVPPTTLPATLPTTLPTTGLTTGPATQPVEMPLTLAEVRKLALVNNLDLKVNLVNPTIAKANLSAAQAQFESFFTTNVNYQNIDQPTGTSLISGRSNDFNGAAGVTVPLETGGSISFGAEADRLKSDSDFQELNPYYTSQAFGQITQPLLRGFGVDANAVQIRIAFYQYQQQEATTKLEVIRVLADADRVYWRLYAARAELDVRKQEHDLAVAQLDRAKRQVAAGGAAEVDVIRAESGVADSVENVINAENDVRQRQRDLKRTLNTPGLAMESSTIIVPSTPPHALAYRLAGPALAEAAMKSRMELLATELNVAQQEASIGAARNAMLPLVLVQYQYQINSLGSTLNNSLTGLRQANFGSHVLGIQVQVPIGNQAARSQLRAAIANRLLQLATKAQQEAQIRQEVLDAMDTLDTDWQRIVAARERVVLAARTAEAEVRGFDEGLRTSTDVLDAQTKLADARSSEVAAVSDYQIAQVDVAFATGTLLGAADVDWRPTQVSIR